MKCENGELNANRLLYSRFVIFHRISDFLLDIKHPL